VFKVLLVQLPDLKVFKESRVLKVFQVLKVFLVEQDLKEFRGVKVLLVQSLDLKEFKVL
jgi:hypothetical protein